MLKLFGMLLTIFAAWFGPISAVQSEPVKGQYVRVELLGEKLNGEARYLSLAELEVFDPTCNIAAGCLNIAAGKSATQTQAWEDTHPASNALNGNPNDFTHTWHIETKQRYHWWEVDLGSELQISHLRITNRVSCCGERINPARVSILDAQRNLLWQGTIDTTQAQYTFENIVKPATPPQTLNLLLNAAFTKRTNPELPDEWGVHDGFAQNVPDAQNLYFVNDSVAPPVPGVKVVELHNPTGYPYLYFLPTSLVERRPPGQYTFSFYLKADAVQPFWIHKGFDTFDTEKTLKTASAEWTRFRTTFSWSGNYRDQGQALDPIIHLPSAGVYHIAAPQLEEGPEPTAFHLAVEDLAPNPPQYINVDPEILAAANNPPVVPQPAVKSVFETDYYTNIDTSARLRIMVSNPTAIDVKCAAVGGTNIVWSRRNVSVNTIYDLSVSLSVFPVGEKYKCTIYGANSAVVLTTSEFQRLAANATESRTNRFTGGLTVKTPTQSQGKLFYIQGMNLHYKAPLTYFEDLKEHGINTIVYFGAVSTTLNTVSNSFADLNDVLTKATSVGLKVIVGVAHAGERTQAAAQNLTNFYTVVDALKGNPTIIGWYPLDEPNNTWTAAELIEIYAQIKQRDPYRFVLVNWTPPIGIGEEPHSMTGVLGSTVTGMLGGTDFYSRTGCYPFFLRGDMSECTKVSLQTQRTARMFNKATHNWLQIWGYGQASREPSLAEFRYMTYLSVLYGSSYSYFGTKSLSAYTWANIGTINYETNWLATNVLYDKATREVIPPRIDLPQQNFIYSVSKKGASTCYVIVIHNDNPTEEFSFDPKSCFSQPKSVKSWFENQRSVPLVAGLIKESFSPYQTRVYVVSR